MNLGRFRYLYLGTKDTSASLTLYQQVFGGDLVWRFQKFGADVGAIRFPRAPDMPVLIFADHKPPGYVLPIFVVKEIDAWRKKFPQASTAETPDGPCLLVEDLAGTKFGLLQEDRPNQLEHV